MLSRRCIIYQHAPRTTLEINFYDARSFFALITELVLLFIITQLHVHRVWYRGHHRSVYIHTFMSLHVSYPGLSSQFSNPQFMSSALGLHAYVRISTTYAQSLSCRITAWTKIDVPPNITTTAAPSTTVSAN